MTRTAAVYTNHHDSAQAGNHLGIQIFKALGDTADAVIVFASSQFEYETLLTSLGAACRPKILVGWSSAGDFTGEQRAEGTACALALCSTDIQASAGLGPAR